VLLLGVGEKTGLFVGTRRGWGRGSTFAGGVGWSEVVTSSMTIIVVRGMFCSVSRLVGALRRRLVDSTKQRPSQPELPSSFRTRLSWTLAIHAA
jgi:hypothetical protein